MLLLLLGAICISFAPILVKLSAVEPTSLAFYRCFFAFLALGAFFVSQRSTIKIQKKNLLYILGGSLCFAIDLFVWHRSIYIVGAGMATILGNTQALYLGLLGAIFLKEKLRLQYFVSLAIAFLGIFLLVDVSQASAVSTSEYYLGIFYGLLTGLSYAGYIFFLRLGQDQLSKMPAPLKLGATLALTSFFLLGMTGFGADLELPRSDNILWILLLALLPQVLGWVLITRSLPKLSVARSAVILLLQPVLASVWGHYLFGESFSIRQLTGGALVLVGIYLGSRA